MRVLVPFDKPRCHEHTEHMQDEMQEPPWFEAWGVVMRFVRDRVERMRHESGLRDQELELIENPQGAIVFKLYRRPGAFVQASISLAGDRIEIRAQDNTGFGAFVDQEPDVIHIEVRGGRAVFIHNDEYAVDPDEVAGIILAPILDYYRSAA
ncbi:MAG: hypothetical protein WB952_11895 [Terriglobales bacterium]